LPNNNPVSDKWANRIIEMYKFYKGLRGDNLRRTGDSAYIGSSGNSATGVNTDWRPRQYRVLSEENDYLVCVPYNSTTGTAGDKEIKVAKPPDMRGGDVLRGVYPNWVAEETVIWAAPFRMNGATDLDDNPITLMQINVDGQSASWFMAKVSSSSSSSEEHSIVEVGEDQQEIGGGRTADNAKAVNRRQGVPVGTMVFALEIKRAEQEPEYWFTILDGLTNNPELATLKTDVGANTFEWEVDDQDGHTGAVFDPARVALSVPAIWFYSRPITVDGTGDVILGWRGGNPATAMAARTTRASSLSAATAMARVRWTGISRSSRPRAGGPMVRT